MQSSFFTTTEIPVSLINYANTWQTLFSYCCRFGRGVRLSIKEQKKENIISIPKLVLCEVGSLGVVVGDQFILSKKTWGVR